MAIGQWAEDYLDGGKSAGGGAGGVVCDLTFEMGEEDPVFTAAMTAGELWTALQNGSSILFHMEAEGITDSYLPLQMATYDPSGYTFDALIGNQMVALVAGNAEGHPSSGGGGK